MSNSPSFVEAYRQLQVTPWSTWEKGSLKDRAFPHSTAATYNGNPCDIRFGAFLGWTEHMRWWVDLASRLSLPSLDPFDLIEIEHQGGGHSVITWFCVAMPVEISRPSLSFVEDLCRHYFHALGGHLDGSLDEAENYLHRISEMGLTADCLQEQNGLMESVYPFDATDTNLRSLLAGPSEALAALEPLLSDSTARERLRIFVIADNSD